MTPATGNSYCFTSPGHSGARLRRDPAQGLAGSLPQGFPGQFAVPPGDSADHPTPPPLECGAAAAAAAAKGLPAPVRSCPASNPRRTPRTTPAGRPAGPFSSHSAASRESWNTQMPERPYSVNWISPVSSPTRRPSASRETFPRQRIPLQSPALLFLAPHRGQGWPAGRTAVAQGPGHSHAAAISAQT